ncbi:L,D-transpeptidase [Streptacidiphilus sp. PAMC 29251]
MERTEGEGQLKLTKRTGALLAGAGIVATACVGATDAQAAAPQKFVMQRAVVQQAVSQQAAAPKAVAATAAVAKAAVAKAAGPNAAGLCPTNLGRIACVDLTHQRMWIQVGKKVVFGPVQVRTGRRGYATRTGLWHIYSRQINHWSTLYNVAMPYSEFFSGGEALHGLNEPMSTPPGSHGCVNMNTWDAKKAWSILKLHDPVKIFGRKPGT